MSIYSSIYADLFSRLERFLVEWFPIWGERPFHTWPPSWSTRHPRLAQALFDLGQQTSIQEYKQTRGLILEKKVSIKWACGLEPDLEESMSLQNEIQNHFPSPSDSIISPSLQAYLEQHPHDLDGVKDRKQKQVKALISTLSTPPSSFLEWCGGKGHLATLLSGYWQQRGGCLEWDPKLTRAGQDRLHSRSHCNLDYHTCDALSSEALNVLSQYPHVIALHACGPLHRQLIEHAHLDHFKAITLIPCCYCLDRTPTTLQNRDYPFPMDEHTLKLATLQRIIVSPRRDFMRIRSMALRLAFSQLHAFFLPHLHHSNPSTLPSLGRKLLRQSSQDVWLTFAQKLKLPHSFQNTLHNLSNEHIQHYEQKGWEALKARSPFEHLRHLFRLPLEMWLVLDRALALEAQGYTVSIDRFCPIEVSPRHFRITAIR